MPDKKRLMFTPLPWRDQGDGMLKHPVSGRALLTRRIETSLGSFEILDETNEPEGNFHLILNAPRLFELCAIVLVCSKRGRALHRNHVKALESVINDITKVYGQ